MGAARRPDLSRAGAGGSAIRIGICYPPLPLRVSVAPLPELLTLDMSCATLEEARLRVAWEKLADPVVRSWWSSRGTGWPERGELAALPEPWGAATIDPHCAVRLLVSAHSAGSGRQRARLDREELACSRSGGSSGIDG